MRERRLEELLRDPRAHAPAPTAAELRATQDAVLARFARETAHAAAPRKLRATWIERAAIAAGAVAATIAGSGWLGTQWQRADKVVSDALPTTPPGGWTQAMADAITAHPLTWTGVLLALALLTVRPVREALLREIR